MQAEAMDPFGDALLAYYEGDVSAEIVVCRDDGQETPLPVAYFFRDSTSFMAMERAAIERCRGRVLDVGAGAGLHSLVLQDNGLSVTAIDVVCATNIMKRRGIKEVLTADVFTFDGGPFDTLLMMGHGIGMVETIEGLKRFLSRADVLLASGGQVLLDSLDVSVSSDPVLRAYHVANKRAGRYVGEIRVRIGFRGKTGPECGWLQVDPETLTVHADAAGWRCETVLKDDVGNHLSQLTRRDA